MIAANGTADIRAFWQTPPATPPKAITRASLPPRLSACSGGGASLRWRCSSQPTVCHFTNPPHTWTLLTSAGGLVVNEVAPRLYNSGHYTIEAVPKMSQCKAKLYAILGKIPRGLKLTTISIENISATRQLIIA